MINIQKLPSETYEEYGRRVELLNVSHQPYRFNTPKTQTDSSELQGMLFIGVVIGFLLLI